MDLFLNFGGYLHVIHADFDTGGIFKHIKMSKERIRGKHISIFTCLNQHLINASIILPQCLLHIAELLVKSPSSLNPQFFDPVLQDDGLEADAEHGEDQDPDEQDLARMLLNEFSKLK